MTDFSVEFELEPRQELEAEISLEQREEMEATFELNVIEEGPQGPQGPVGPAGKDAKINGVNTLTLETTNGVTQSQSGTTLTLSGKTLQDAITAETNRAESAESSLNTAISGKQAQLTQAQLNAVNSGINTTKVSAYDNHIANTTIHVTAQEKTTWNNKQDKINDLQTIRDGASAGSTAVQPNDMTTAISTHNTSSQAHTDIRGLITTESENRENADIGLQSQIDAIVASSDVTDIVGTYAQLQAYDTSGLPPNSIIKVLQDESRNNETTYYRWVINGGVGSWVLIGEEGPYYTKSEADVRFATAAQGAKADTALQPSALNGYATEQWVGQQGFLTSTALAGYATEQWVQNQGYLTGVDSSEVINALGYTPYNASNPDGFITSSAISNMQTTTNLVTSISSLSTDTEYPSAKCMWDIVGDIESAINAIRGV